MTGWLIALCVLVVASAFIWLVIRTDTKAEAAYQRWYDNPEHVWNP